MPIRRHARRAVRYGGARRSINACVILMRAVAGYRRVIRKWRARLMRARRALMRDARPQCAALRERFSR